tara:strand:+ start:1436 stop:1717 length:282 start_codon:yes stop_codon:yes gene_type:complete
MVRDYRMKDFTITEEEVTSLIHDAEGDELYLRFDYDECVNIDTSKLTYIHLTLANLRELTDLIERAEDYFNKKFAMGNPSKTILEPPIVKNNE